METKASEEGVPPATPPSTTARQRSRVDASPSPTPALRSSPREHDGPPTGLLGSVPGGGMISSAFRAAFRMFNMVLAPLNSIVGGRDSTPPDALSAARQFITMFEMTYGEGGPSFVEASFQDALATANADCRMALVYLHSDLNQDTDEFCRETLRHPPLVEFMRTRFISWGGDVGEAHALDAANKFEAPSFPFIGVYMPQQSSNKFRRVWSHEGMISGDDLLAKMEAAVAAADSDLEGIRAERVAREADRLLRAEQDMRYQEALAQDRERERKQEEEAEAKLLEEAKEMSKQLSQDAELERIRGRLPEEPSVGTTEETTRMRLTLPDGTKIQRRFFAADTVQTVFDFVTLSLHDLGSDITSFEVGSSYPRKTFAPTDDLEQDLKAAGLTPQAVLFVTAR